MRNTDFTEIIISNKIKKQIENLYEQKKTISQISTKVNYSNYKVKQHLINIEKYNPTRDTDKKLPGTNPKVSETKYAKIWDYEKNKKGPENYTTGSDYKAWWKCKKCKLNYDAAIHIICNPKTSNGCPFCSFKRPSYFHNLKLKYPEVTKYFLEDKNNIKAIEVAPGSKKTYWWKCDKNHIFENTPLNMTKTDKKSCRFCNGTEAWPGESLGDLFPILVSEIEPEFRKSFDPFKVTPGSTKKIKWKCKKNHTWVTTIWSRTGRGTGCSKCKMPYSREELRIYTELKLIFKNTKIRFKKFDEEIDIFIPSLDLAIEFDGYYWHLNKEQRDIEKTKKLLKNKINVIRIRENLKTINGINIHVKTGVFENKDFLLIIKQTKKLVSQKEFLEKINNRLKLSKFQNDELYLKILADMPAPVYENSLQAVYPKAAKKWDYSKNYPLTPDQVSKGTPQIFWFICDKKKHSYDSPVQQVVKKNHNCPFCMSKRIDKSNSLATLFPEIAAEWHPTKNKNLLPTQVAPNYAKKIWWLCPEGDEYDGTCNKRVNSKSGCPYCSGLLPRKGESIKDKYPEFCNKIKRIITKGKISKKTKLVNIGDGAHIKVAVKCKDCSKEIIRQVREFVTLISNNSDVIYICDECRTFNLDDVKKLISKDLTIQEMSNILGTNYYSLHSFLKNRNLKTISDAEKKAKDDKQILEYLNQGFTGRATAKKFNCSEAKVSTVKNGYKRI